VDIVHQRSTWLEALAASWLLIILLASIVFIPRWIYPPLSAQDLRGISSPQVRIQLQQAQSQLANNARSTVLQLIAGLVVVAGAIATWRQVHVSRESQITERFTRAVEQLGNQNVDVRVGGIYALERIAKDSQADRNAIQFLLAAFIRNHANWPMDTADGPNHPAPALDNRLLRLRVRAPDVQVAIAVLGRRPRSRDERFVNLPRVDLRGVTLNGARLDGAALQESNLAHAELNNVGLRRAYLAAADLHEAILNGSDLTAADLADADLQGADLRQANLSRAILRGADLTGAILDQTTVLTGVQSDSATIWPTDLNPERRHELGITEVDP
jgi:hypothetical protein